MKRIAERAPELDIFGQKLVVREPGGSNITGESRSFLAILKGRVAATEDVALAEPSPASLMTGPRARPGP